MTPRALGPWPESAGTAGQPRSAPGMGPSRPGELVDHAGTWTWAQGARDGWSTPGALDRVRVTLESWWTPRELRPGPKSPGTAGRASETWDKGPSAPGQLVEPAAHWTRARVTWESWSTPRALRPWSQSPRTAGRHRGPLEPGLRRPGQVVDLAVPLARALITRESWSKPRSLEPGPRWTGSLVDPALPGTRARVARDSWSSPRDHGHGRESSWTAGQPRGDSELGPSRPGQLVDNAGTRTRGQDARDSWSTTQVLGSGPKFPRTAGRHCGHCNRSQGRQGYLIEPAGLGTQARVIGTASRIRRHWNPGPGYPGHLAGQACGTSGTGPSLPGSSLKLQAIGPESESPRRAARPCGASDPSTSHPGVLVNTAGLRILARVTQECWPNPPTFGSWLESPGRAGHHRRPSGPGARRL